MNCKMILVDATGRYHGTVIAYVTRKIAVYNEKTGKNATFELKNIQGKELMIEIIAE